MSQRPRIVVITQGSESTIVAKAGQIFEYDVPKIDASEIVDVNGAGDGKS